MNYFMISLCSALESTFLVCDMNILNEGTDNHEKLHMSFQSKPYRFFYPVRVRTFERVLGLFRVFLIALHLSEGVVHFGSYKRSIPQVEN